MSPTDKPGIDKGSPVGGLPIQRSASSRLDPIGAHPEAPVSLTGFALEVHHELSQHMSPPNCRVLMAACAAASGVAEAALEPDHLPFITAQVDRMFSVFGVHPDVKARCIANLRGAARQVEHRDVTLILITQEDDVITARNLGRDICHDLGFTEVAHVKVATAISELARNILKYAGKGQITLRRLPGERKGIEVIASDQGPGIADVELVLSPRYRSRTGMGVGLRGSRRLMDHFEVDSRVGSGTTVVLRKYRF